MAVSRVCFSSRVPLIIILGATGTGKTKLSLELAEKYKTEIISADSMQIYKGLDIVSAKATLEERSIAPHHFLDILQPHQTYTVLDFRNKAVSLIDEMMARQQIPIVVGGTNYYIESILWKILVEDMSVWDTSKLIHERDQEKKAIQKKRKIDTPCTSGETVSLQSCAKDETNSEESGDQIKERVTSGDSVEDDFSEDSKLSTEYLFTKLKEVDPEMAERLHPNNRRKILRSLQVWAETGRSHSATLRDQRAEEGGCGLGGPLRYSNAVIFWMHCQQDVLDARLATRVDAMAATGLLQELTDFHENYNKQRLIDGQPTDYTKGIFQSIGFKEFHEYLILSEVDRNTSHGQKMFAESLENMKIATKRYARRQNKMVKNRFLGHPNRQVPPIYKLDTTDVSKWNENVTEKAVQIIEHIVNGTECVIQPEPFSVGPSYIGGINPNVSHFCETCKRVFIGDHQYDIHKNSIKHKKQTRKANKAKISRDMKPANKEDGSSSF